MRRASLVAAIGEMSSHIGRKVTYDGDPGQRPRFPRFGASDTRLLGSAAERCGRRIARSPFPA